MEHGPIRKTANGIEVDILVVSKASSATVVGVHGDRIKIRVVSPPQKNKANAAVIDLLCNATGASRAEVTRGRTGRHKTVLLTGVTIETVTRSLVSSPT